MRLLASSDLHYNIPRSKEPAKDLARRVIRRGGDVLVLAGDIAGVDSDQFLQGLELFSGFTGEKLLVAGNHDLWVGPEQCSWEKWTRVLPDLARSRGFSMLDHQPRVLGDIGFVGNVGWYDYGFRDERLKIPVRFYEAKVAPGRAFRLAEYRRLLDPDEPLPPEHEAITTSWRDGEHVRLPMSDPEFVVHLCEKMQADLATLADRCKEMIAVTHHVPCRNLVWYRGDANWDFAAAFLGSQRFGDLFRETANLRWCLSGHSHRDQIVKIGGMKYITIGSTYVEKALLELDI